MMKTENLLYFHSVPPKPTMPASIDSAFTLFYSQYLDKPDREMLWEDITQVCPQNSLSANCSLLQAITEEFITDCYMAGEDLLTDLRPLPPKSAKACSYLQRAQTVMPQILSAHLRGISGRAGSPDQDEPVRCAVYDFLFAVGSRAYYEAAKSTYRHICA